MFLYQELINLSMLFETFDEILLNFIFFWEFHSVIVFDCLRNFTFKILIYQLKFSFFCLQVQFLCPLLQLSHTLIVQLRQMCPLNEAFLSVLGLFCVWFIWIFFNDCVIDFLCLSFAFGCFQKIRQLTTFKVFSDKSSPEKVFVILVYFLKCIVMIKVMFSPLSIFPHFANRTTLPEPVFTIDRIIKSLRSSLWLCHHFYQMEFSYLSRFSFFQL